MTICDRVLDWQRGLATLFFFGRCRSLTIGRPLTFLHSPHDLPCTAFTFVWCLPLVIFVMFRPSRTRVCVVLQESWLLTRKSQSANSTPITKERISYKSTHTHQSSWDIIETDTCSPWSLFTAAHSWDLWRSRHRYCWSLTKSLETTQPCPLTSCPVTC